MSHRASARQPCFPHATRYASGWLLVGISLALLAATGCAVPTKALEQLRIDTAAADRAAELWPTITPEKREEAYLKLRQGVWVLRYTFTGDLPDPEDDPALRAKILELGGESE